ncbi:MAG TPA: Uma2 family endonuclease [Gammaproteobacteria bacterium]
MTKPLKKDATYTDLCAVPENFVAEILGGELYAFPRPASPHAHAAGRLFHKLSGPFQDGENGPGGWLFLMEPELHFGADVVVPNIAGWRIERMPTIPNVAFFTLAPDWLCEVLSPSTEAIDRRKKLAIYARAGVSHVWLLNPLLQTLEVLRLESQRWSLISAHEADAKIRAEPFGAVELVLRALWL